MPIIRMLAYRVVRLAAVGAVALTIIPLHTAVASGQAIDLAAGLLSPDDVAAAGYTDYGIATGYAHSAEALAGFAAAQRDDPEAARQAVLDSGVESLYYLTLHPYQDSDATRLEQGVAIQSQITSYVDEASAESAFTTVETMSYRPETADDLSNPPGIGDQTVVTEWESGSGTDLVHGFDVRFRIGRLTGMATVAGFQADVDRTQAEELAVMLSVKVQALLDGTAIDGARAPELSIALPRYEGDAFAEERADYQVYDGESVPNAYNLDVSENFQSSVDDYGMVAQFYIGTQIVPDDANSDASPYLIVRATRFSRASDATRYIDETVGNLLDNPAPYDRVDPIPADDLPVYGDATSGYAYTYSVPAQGPSDGVAILFQQGRVVYELELEGVVAPDMTVVDAVVQNMLDCADEGCETAVAVPASLTEYIDEQTLLGKKSG